MTCECHFCRTNQAHPDDRHRRFAPYTGILTVPESLDPEDVIHMEYCLLFRRRNDDDREEMDEGRRSREVRVNDAERLARIKRAQEPWTNQQERLLRAAQDLLNNAEVRDGERKGDAVILSVSREDFIDLQAVVGEIADDAALLLRVIPKQAHGYYVMTYGGGAYTAVAWFLRREDAEAKVARICARGAWGGHPPLIQAGTLGG